MMKMKKTIFTISLFIMTCFLSFGYAALSDSLNITGSAHVEGKPFKGVYIKEVTVFSNNGATSAKNDYELPTNHKITVDPARSGGSITYKITVHNNTDVTYWYIGQRFETTYEDNNLINSNNGITVITKDFSSDNYLSFNNEDWVPPQTLRDFYVTYTFGSNAQDYVTLMINYFFDIKMDAVHDEFLAVLNNVKEETSYEYLSNVFDTEYSKTGNVHITSDSHPDVFNKLFEDLVVNIDGVERTATVVIRRENMDNDLTSGDNYLGNGPKGCEYTLYITVESLVPGDKPIVYAIAYSQGASGMGDDWYQVGELYEGTAPINADGSIDYKNWIATPNTYEMADGIKYNVGYQNGDQYDIMKTMEQLISAEDQDIFNDIDNTKIFKKVYDIIQKHNGSTDPAVHGLRQAFTDASIFYNNLNNGQEFKVVRNKYTRAEIIHAIKKIQTALDYYYETFGN